MSYQYDDKINRDLAKTAMAIYINDNTPGAAQNLNETRVIAHQQQLNESATSYEPMTYPRTDDAITNVLLEYVTNTCLLAEQNIGRAMNDYEISNFSQYILENIDRMGQPAQVRLVTELLEAADGGMSTNNQGGAGAAGVEMKNIDTSASGAGLDDNAAMNMDEWNEAFRNLMQNWDSYGDNAPRMLSQLLGVYPG